MISLFTLNSCSISILSKVSNTTHLTTQQKNLEVISNSFCSLSQNTRSSSKSKIYSELDHFPPTPLINIKIIFSQDQFPRLYIPVYNLVYERTCFRAQLSSLVSNSSLKKKKDSKQNRKILLEALEYTQKRWGNEWDSVQLIPTNMSVLHLHPSVGLGLCSSDSEMRIHVKQIYLKVSPGKHEMSKKMGLRRKESRTRVQYQPNRG